MKNRYRLEKYKRYSLSKAKNREKRRKKIRIMKEEQRRRKKSKRY